jgi:hypothetical protein
MSRRLGLVRTDVSEEHVASIFSVERNRELRTITPKMEAKPFSETSVITRSIPHHISEDSIIHSHRRENLKSYTSYFS